MTTYTAWDGNEYPLPTPAGWYLAVDDRWWPEGHGPGPAPADSSPPSTDLPFAAPPSNGVPSAAPPSDGSDWGQDLDRTIYSSPPPGAGGPVSQETTADQGGGAKKLVIAVVALLLLAAVGVGAFVALGSDDDETVTPATTVFQTQQSDLDDAPTTTVGEDADPGAVDTSAVAPGKGSLEDPYRIDEPILVEYTDIATGELRQWEIVVNGQARDITEAVLEENQFNDPPEGDQRFMAVPVSVGYVSGPAPASLFELTFKAVGPSGVVLTTFDPSCGVIPDALDTFAELFPGGVTEGNVCWPASPSDAGDLTMLIEVFLEDTEIYVDLGG